MSPVAIAFSSARTVGFVEEEERSLAEHEVRVRTLYSGISSGTELTAYRGSNPYLHKRWDGESRLFVTDLERSSIDYPVVGWGHERREIRTTNDPFVDEDRAFLAAIRSNDPSELLCTYADALRTHRLCCASR